MQCGSAGQKRANLRSVNTPVGPELQPAIDALRAGGLCAIPTETVYGLAANALLPDAVVRIFEVKRRPAFDPLIVHVGDTAAAQRVTTSWTDAAHALAARFWPGPLTLVLPRSEAIPDIVTSGLATVGVRVPAHPVTLELLRQLDFPLAAPSANPFGYISPTTAQHVTDQLDGMIDYILDGGPCQVGIESTIVDCSGPETTVLRLGGLSLEAIERTIGQVSVNLHSSSRPGAPGMLTAHYAPSKPLRLVHSLIEERSSEWQQGRVLAWQNIPEGLSGEVLSPAGDLHEAARELFTLLRRLDSGEGSFLIAEQVPDTGLGRAINDRLRRAAAGSTP